MRLPKNAIATHSLRRVVIAMLLPLFLTAGLFAQAPILIDFENAPGPDLLLNTPDDIPLTEGTNIGTQFTAQGVTINLINNPGSKPYIVSAGLPTGGWVSPEDGGIPSGSNALTDGFVGAGNNIPGANNFQDDLAFNFIFPMNNVTMTLIDAENAGIGIVAFDANGVQVGSDFVTNIGNLSLNVLSISAPAIARVETVDFTTDAGLGIDDLTFTPANTAPALSEWGLLILFLGFLCLGAIVLWKQRFEANTTKVGPVV